MMKKLMIMVTAFTFMASPMVFAGDAVDLQAKPQQSRGGKMFKNADKNGDGVVSKKEFLASLETRFEKIDTDNNGEISHEEARAHAKKMHGKFKNRRQGNTDG